MFLRHHQVLHLTHLMYSLNQSGKRCLDWSERASSNLNSKLAHTEDGKVNWKSTFFFLINLQKCLK
jgi:hypothetical protein